MFEDLIRDIKFWRKILVVFFSKGGRLIRLHTKEHMILFFKMEFRAMMINLLLHSILSYGQIIFETKKYHPNL
jgi:hypothetical protein